MTSFSVATYFLKIIRICYNKDRFLVIHILSLDKYIIHDIY